MSNFETEVKDSLNSMDGKLDELVTWKAALNERCKAHREQTDDMRETLYGNPNGIVKTVNNLWNFKKNASRWRDFWLYVLKIVVAAAVIASAGWLLAAYKVIEIGG